jgi:hypothetical protein
MGNSIQTSLFKKKKKNQRTMQKLQQGPVCCQKLPWYRGHVVLKGGRERIDNPIKGELGGI